MRGKPAAVIGADARGTVTHNHVHCARLQKDGAREQERAMRACSEEWARSG
jgi:hypothetical protein